MEQIHLILLLFLLGDLLACGWRYWALFNKVNLPHPDPPSTFYPSKSDIIPSDCCFITASRGNDERKALLFGHSLQTFINHKFHTELLHLSPLQSEFDEVLLKYFDKIRTVTDFADLHLLDMCSRIVYLTIDGVFNADPTPLCKYKTPAAIQNMFNLNEPDSEVQVVDRYNKKEKKFNFIDPMLSLGYTDHFFIDFLFTFEEPSFLRYTRWGFDNQSVEFLSRIQKAYERAKAAHPDLLTDLKSDIKTS